MVPAEPAKDPEELDTEEILEKSGRLLEAARASETVKEYLFPLFLDHIDSMPDPVREVIATKLRAWAEGVAMALSSVPEDSPSSGYIKAIRIKANEYARKIEPDVIF